MRLQSMGLPRTNNAFAAAAGLRNPHRYEWDTSAGKLYLSDIGQSYLQEVNIVDNGAKTTVGPTQEGTIVICNDASENNYEIKAGVTDTTCTSIRVIQYDHDQTRQCHFRSDCLQRGKYASSARRIRVW